MTATIGRCTIRRSHLGTKSVSADLQNRIRQQAGIFETVEGRRPRPAYACNDWGRQRVLPRQGRRDLLHDVCICIPSRRLRAFADAEGHCSVAASIISRKNHHRIDIRPEGNSRTISFVFQRSAFYRRGGCRLACVRLSSTAKFRPWDRCHRCCVVPRRPISSCTVGTANSKHFHEWRFSLNAHAITTEHDERVNLVLHPRRQ